MKCYDCGSTIPGHHTPNCEMAGEGDIMDLPRQLGTQWWVGELPESAGDLRYKELTELEVNQLRSENVK